MRALIDTNILIHRETKDPIVPDIGTLFFWLDRLGYKVCIHPLTKTEISRNQDKQTVSAFDIKMQSYQLMRVPTEIHSQVKKICDTIDFTPNDINDTKMLDEVFCDRVDIFITEDKKIHEKATLLGIAEKVFTINNFLYYVKQQVPELIDYDVLAIRKKYFSEIDLKDPFFDSFRLDYPGFDKWFARKYSEQAYVLFNEHNGVEAFLYLKIEDKSENYWDISPTFEPKKRLKIGTFKVCKVGMRLGERFLKIIFDNAKKNDVDEIYVTIFKHNASLLKLIEMLEMWGFFPHGNKKNGELVYCRKFTRGENTPVNREEPKKTFPYISQGASFYILSIYPQFHTDLFPDSILRGENLEDFIDAAPHRNAISKCYISNAPMKDLKSGDALVFYRTGGKYKGVATTVGIVESVIVNIKNEGELISLTRNKTVFNENDLRSLYRKSKNWSKEFQPFIINFLYRDTLRKKPNLEKLIELHIVDKAPRGIVKINRDQFKELIEGNL